MVSGFSFTFLILCVGMIFTGTCDKLIAIGINFFFFLELVCIGSKYSAFKMLIFFYIA